MNIDGSIRVNSHFQTEDSSIFAAGDIAQFPSLLSESRERVEHWAVAQQQGRFAAMNMLEKGTNYLDVPFFWTNQFLNVQFAGYANGHNWTFTETKKVNETEEKLPRITYFFKDERCIGVAATNWPGAVLRLKIALQRGLMPTRKELTSGQVTFDKILEKVKNSNPCGGNCCRKN
jgi:NADPH-dependent 2,4-dienoyl-CoA reductase/sulfur reductase-like enzyme